jgi:hypothetical protein
MKTLYIILAFVLMTTVTQAQFTEGVPGRTTGEIHYIADKLIGAGDSAHVFGKFPMVDRLGVRYDSIHVFVEHADSIDYVMYLKVYGLNNTVLQDTTGNSIIPKGGQVTRPSVGNGAGFIQHNWGNGISAVIPPSVQAIAPFVVVQSGSAMASDNEQFTVRIVAFHKDRN